MIEEHRRDAQFSRIELRKDVVSVIRAIVVAYTCVIAPHDEMRATIVLAHERVEDGFTRTGIAHGGRQHAKYYPVSWIVVRQQHFVTAYAYSSRDIVLLGSSDQGMQVQAIYRLQGAFLNIFLRTMHGIPCLEPNDTLPTALADHLPAFTASTP